MSATIKPFTDEFEEYGRDESRASGEASSISFPTTENEVRAILEKLHVERVPVTVQGARTGLAAGAVPHGGRTRFAHARRTASSAPSSILPAAKPRAASSGEG